MAYKYDVFISYRQKPPDKEFVKNFLVPEFERNGLTVFIDYKNFKLGAPIITEMERGVTDSKFTLAVLSPTYLVSNFTEFENIISDHLGLLNSERKLIAIMLESCTPRLGIRAKLWLDFTNEDAIKANLPRLIDGLKENPDV